jgi:N-acetylneuraminic acid mutarotase
VYNPATNSWRTLSPLPTPGYALAAAVINGVVYVVGGYGAGGSYLTTTQAYTR